MKTGTETRKGRILNVRITIRQDEYPDISYLGKYASRPGPADRTIDRDARGDMGRNEFQYFIATMSGEDRGNPDSVEQDYLRFEAYNIGDWCMLGIKAEAEVTFPGSDVVQRITSGGLWGIESDSGEDYLKVVEAEQLSELREELARMGYGRRAIAEAFKTVEHR